MNDEVTRIRTLRTGPRGPDRRRRWTRRVLMGLAALLVLVVLGAWALITFSSVPAALALPARVSTPAGPLDGSWHVAAGSVAGFRVPETAFGLSNDTVGRTGHVTGTVTVTGGQVTGASFRIDVASVLVNGKPQPQVSASLRTRRYPDATFSLAGPVTLGPAFAAGGTLHATAAGRLVLNGLSRPVTVTVTARRDGAAIELAGTVPVSFATWDITGPAGFGFVYSLAGHGEVEFLLALRR
jgi:polyisoprenoid-binding protein YceI